MPNYSQMASLVDKVLTSKCFILMKRIYSMCGPKKDEYHSNNTLHCCYHCIASMSWVWVAREVIRKKAATDWKAHNLLLIVHQYTLCYHICIRQKYMYHKW